MKCQRQRETQGVRGSWQYLRFLQGFSAKPGYNLLAHPTLQIRNWVYIWSVWLGHWSFMCQQQHRLNVSDARPAASASSFHLPPSWTRRELAHSSDCCFWVWDCHRQFSQSWETGVPVAWERNQNSSIWSWSFGKITLFFIHLPSACKEYPLTWKVWNILKQPCFMFCGKYRKRAAP